jgi:hypothetical protein
MDWKDLVSKVAPWIGTALGGPLGGAAITAIADALGLNEKTEEAVKAALSGTTPEQMLALKKADQEFSLKLKEIGFANEKDMESLAVQDRDSARKREVSLNDKTVRNLAYLITLGFFSLIVALMFVSIPADSKAILYVLTGSLGTAWTGVTAYYFGSTKGSQAKTDLLAKAQPIKD